MRVKLKTIKQHKLWLKDKIKNQQNFNKKSLGKKSKIKRIRIKLEKLYMINCNSMTKLITFKTFIIVSRMKINNKKYKDWNW